MIRPLNDPPPHDSQRRWMILYGAAGVIAIIILVVVYNRAESTTDFRDFWENAVHFLKTGEVATELGVHNYLPFFTLFMLPWGLLPLPPAAVLFVALSLGLFTLTATTVERLLYDGPRTKPRRALLIALGLALPYVYACAILGNLGLLLLFLVVAAWYLVEARQEWAAGVALGLAVLIKLLPGALLIFFLLKWRWRVVAAAGATVVVLGLGLPLLALGPERTYTLHHEFYKDAIQGHSARQTIFADKPQKTNYSNNALPMVLRRLLTQTDGGSEKLGALYVNIVNWPRQRVWWTYLAVFGAILALSAAATLRGPGWPPGSREAVRHLRMQFGVWCCVMLLASPLVWTHYLPLVYWPLALLADRGERTARAHQTPCRVSMAALLAWLVLAILLAWPVARALGAQLASVLVVWGVLVYLLLRRRELVDDQRQTDAAT